MGKACSRPCRGHGSLACPPAHIPCPGRLRKVLWLHGFHPCRALLQVEDLSSKPTVAREIMLVKVRCTAGQRAELTNVAHIFHGGVCDVGLKTITLEFTGKEDKMAAVQRLLVPYGASPQPHFSACSLAHAYVQPAIPRPPSTSWPVRLYASTACVRHSWWTYLEPPAADMRWHTGILEIARTGRVALARDLGINTRFLGRMKSGVPAFPVY